MKMTNKESNKKHCILIYEDDFEIMELCKIILNAPDRLIVTRASCDNIIEDAEQIQPNVILMDLWIPKIGGEQATIQLKKNTKTESIPVILFSANDNILEISKKVNADGYLKKPFDIEDLKSAIEKQLK